jgi:hypothetical protein
LFQRILRGIPMENVLISFRWIFKNPFFRPQKQKLGSQKNFFENEKGFLKTF